MPTRTVRRVSDCAAKSPSPSRTAHVATPAALRAPGSAVLAPASLRQCLGQTQQGLGQAEQFRGQAKHHPEQTRVDLAERADLSARATRDQALASVAAWRRADTWRDAAAPVPAWALGMPVGAPQTVSGGPASTQEADEAEERGLSLAMGGLMVGGLLASLLGESAALGCALGLIAGAGLGWPLPLSALTQGLGKVRRV